MEQALLPHLLRGAWRSQVEPWDGPENVLGDWLAALSGAGVGALVWRRLQAGALGNSPVAGQLSQVHRMQVLQGALNERFIAVLFENLHHASVDAMLIKGWASARYYAVKGLRPFGDLDIHVRPEQLPAAQAALEYTLASADSVMEVDLKGNFETRSLAGIYGRSNADFLSAALQQPLGSTRVTVPCPEDHLRLVGLHFLKHGAERPLWLCDVAAALEARGTDFDWERCLGVDACRRNWVANVLLLAHQLLGADIQNTPLEEWRGREPKWLAASVLSRWQTTLEKERRLLEASGGHTLQDRVQAHRDLRWKDPITASVLFHVPFGRTPRLPFQTALYVYSFVPGLKPIYSALRPKC